MIHAVAFFAAVWIVVVHATQAPVGQPVLFRFGTGSNGQICITAEDRDGGAVVIADCTNGFTVNNEWTADRGGASEGDGPATPIRIFEGTKCLDVTGGVDKAGTKLQVWTCGKNNPNQQFTINSDLSITWVGHEKCIDLTNGNTASGTQLQIWDCIDGNKNQRWTPLLPNDPSFGIQPHTGRTFQMKSTQPPPALAAGCITAGSGTNGSPVTLDNCFSDSPPQIWAVEKGGGIGTGPAGQLQIFVVDFCLDVTNGVKANGTKLQIWRCGSNDSNPNQQWQVNGDKTIRWAGTGMCIDLTNGHHTVGNQLQIWACDPKNPNQQWDSIFPL